MKYSVATALLLVASATAFAPTPNNGRVSSALSVKFFDTKKSASPAEEKSVASRVFGMDLFDPENNKYGARNKKQKTATGKLSSNSYIPAGLTKAQYEKIRTDEKQKKEARYKEKMAKAGIFEDFTEWYKARGTDESDGWIKSVTRGHTMVKTKYDWSGNEDKPLWAKVANKKK